MKSHAKLIAATTLACVCVFGLLAVAKAILASGLEGDELAQLNALIDRQYGTIVMVALFACAFIFMMLRSAHDFLVRTPAKAAEEVGAMIEDPTTRLTRQGSAELLAIVDAVNRLAEKRQSWEIDIGTRIRQANAAAETDRNRFAALVSELAQGVIVCNLDGRILLYNRRARAIFSAGDGQNQSLATLGLGRSVYGVFDRHLIAYALDGVSTGQGVHRHFVAVSESGRLLRALVAPVRGDTGINDEASADSHAEAISGYLIMIDDMTEAYDSESDRDQLLQDLTENSRGSMGNLRAAAEMLNDYPDMEVEQRQRFNEVVRAESSVLGNRMEEAARRFAAVLKARWPLEEMLGADFVTAACRRIGERCQLPVSALEVDFDIWIKVDSFSLLQAMTYLAVRLRDEYTIRDLKIRLTRDGEMAQLDLIWSGAFMSTETVMTWEIEPMHTAGESSPLTVRDVVERSGGEIWFQRERTTHRAYFRFLLPAAAGMQKMAERNTASDELASRPEFYDFDLFRGDETGHALADRLLTQLTFTAFDTETTGLEPSAGDEIIQIGAVRIVNRRILRQESYEQLIDPQRSLPAKSVKIHGISADMLVGQPTIGKVLPVFRAFVADTVLVAHNAAFDMRFLELKEKPTGIRFDLPVLDTLLLSAVIFPNQETHRLEAIAERLGVSVFGRHTAVGDAIVTAEVFLKMLPLLAEKGIHTLGDARQASEKTYLARVSY